MNDKADMPLAEPDDNREGEDISNVAERQFEVVRLALARRRRALGMTMSDLARQIGVSPSMVSQIERGQSLPSVGTLFALAAALGATVDAFLAAPETTDDVKPPPLPASVLPASAHPEATDSHEAMYVVRHASRVGVDIRGGVRWERLTPTSLGGTDFLELIYEPGAASDSQLYRHPGLEMLLVLEGRFEIHIGFERYELEPGDSMAFPSSLPHRYVNPTDRRSRAVTTILRDVVGGSEGGRSPKPLVDFVVRHEKGRS